MEMLNAHDTEWRMKTRRIKKNIRFCCCWNRNYVEHCLLSVWTWYLFILQYCVMPFVWWRFFRRYFIAFYRLHQIFTWNAQYLLTFPLSSSHKLFFYSPFHRSYSHSQFLFHSKSIKIHCISLAGIYLLFFDCIEKWRIIVLSIISVWLSWL